MSIRSITVKPTDLILKPKKTRTKSIPPTSEINTSNIRKLLLEKLKAHKMTQKNIKLNTGEFDGIQYGNLKGGTKPTYREWKRTSSGELPAVPPPENNLVVPPPENKPAVPPPNPLPIPSVELVPIPETNNELKKIFSLGKQKDSKMVSIMIKSIKNRKNIHDIKNEYKKTKLNTIKKYLKEKNLIKFGTTAPSGLLKELYESSNSCGDVYNKNAKTLLHNFNINKDDINE